MKNRGGEKKLLLSGNGQYLAAFNSSVCLLDREAMPLAGHKLSFPCPLSSAVKQLLEKKSPVHGSKVKLLAYSRVAWELGFINESNIPSLIGMLSGR